MQHTPESLIESLNAEPGFEADIVNSVIRLDEYRLQAMRDAGFSPKLIVDIGGHIGSFAMFAKWVWPASKVITVEPLPVNFARLCNAVGGLPAVYPENAAIVGEPIAGDYVEVFLSDDGNTAAASTMRTAGRESIKARAMSICELLSKHKWPDVDLLKLDCEGEEGPILRDLARMGFLDCVDAIVGEWHFVQNIPIIEDALRQTHSLELYRHECDWGAFFARRRLVG